MKFITQKANLAFDITSALFISVDLYKPFGSLIAFVMPSLILRTHINTGVSS